MLLRKRSWNLRQRDAVTPGERCGVSPPSAFAVQLREQRSKVMLSIPLQFSSKIFLGALTPSVGSRRTARRLCDLSVFICVHP
jgi:hypothetical protein